MLSGIRGHKPLCDSVPVLGRELAGFQALPHLVHIPFQRGCTVSLPPSGSEPTDGVPPASPISFPLQI